MILLFDTFITENLTIKNGLQQIFGIGPFYSKYFLKKLGLSENMKVKNLTSNHVKQLTLIIENSKIIINNNLKILLFNNNNKHINLKSYKGLRKLNGYPVRGQRTRSNAKTAKNLLKKSKTVIIK